MKKKNIIILYTVLATILYIVQNYPFVLTSIFINYTNIPQITKKKKFCLDFEPSGYFLEFFHHVSITNIFSLCLTPKMRVSTVLMKK